MLKEFCSCSAVQLAANCGIAKDHSKLSPTCRITIKTQRQIYKQNPEKLSEIPFLEFNQREKKDEKGM